MLSSKDKHARQLDGCLWGLCLLFGFSETVPGSPAQQALNSQYSQGRL